VQRGLYVSGAVVAGTALGVISPVPVPQVMAVALAGGSVALLARTTRWSQPWWLVALAALSAARGAAVREQALNPPLRSWYLAHARDAVRLPEPVLLVGRLASDAAVGATGVELVIVVTRMGDAGGWHDVTGRVRLTVAGSLAGRHVETWTAGRPVRAPALLRLPRVAANPGGPSDSRQRLRRREVLTGTIKSATLIEVHPAPWWDEAAAAVRRHVRRAMRRYVEPLDAQAAAVATAILIGDRAGLDDEIVGRLQAAGTYHVIAISGGNVALVAGGCFLLVRLVVRSGRAVAIGTMAVVTIYGWVVGGDPSVTRAVTAAVVYLGVGLIGLRPRPLPVIGTVALLVVTADPLTVLDVAAWLSFGATMGIVVGAGRAQRAARAWVGSERRLATAGMRALLGIGCATLAAEAALLPIAAIVFSRVGVAGLLTNLVAVPSMAVVQVAAAAVVVCAPVSATAAALTARVVHLSALVLVDSARVVDVAPWLSWRVPPASVAWAAVYYVAWTVRLVVSSRLARRGALIVVGLATGVLLSAPGTGLARPAAGILRLTLIDVGQGDAILVQFPTRHAMLVDAGGAGIRADAVSRLVVSTVWALGERRLDWLVVTHADRDHVLGAPGVVRDLRPAEVWEGIPVDAEPGRTALVDAARRHGAVWRTVHAGHRLDVGDVAVEVRHPAAPDWERPRVRNNDSVVLRLTYGDVEWLLTGDAAEEFEQPAAGSPTAGAIRVLKVAHHGSRTSSGQGFVDRYRPHLALISVGQGNLFGHPAPEVTDRLTRIGAETFRTDRDGAIQVETDGVRLRVRTARGRVRWLERF